MKQILLFLVLQLLITFNDIDGYRLAWHLKRVPLLWRLKLKQQSNINSLDETNIKISTNTNDASLSANVNPLATTEKEKNPFLQKILCEKAQQFYDPRFVPVTEREKCILLAVDTSQNIHHRALNTSFTLEESLSELSELVGTAGLIVSGYMIQRLPTIHPKTYIGSGKIQELVQLLNSSNVQTVVIDDDLSAKQQRNLEDAFEKNNLFGIKLLDRSAIILEIFAQHANSKEGQLQVELAMLEYRVAHGPKSRGADYDRGCGFRGPGESKIETDRRLMKDKIYLLKKEIEVLGQQRNQYWKSREKLEVPVVALVGYTNAGKSTLMNQLSHADVFAENMLFATLDPTTRKITLPKKLPSSSSKSSSASANEGAIELAKGQEVFLTDTVGFISKLPTHLIAAFRATLEEVKHSDVLIIVCDRSNPVWEKQRETVYQELSILQCQDKPTIELWNKIDQIPLPDEKGERNSGNPFELEIQAELESYQQNKEKRLSDNFAIVAASAKTGQGMNELITKIEEMIQSKFQQSISILLPYQETQHQYLVNQIHLQGKIQSIEHLEEGTKIVCSLPPRLFEKVKPFQI